MATQDEQKGRWKTAGGNANPRKRKEAVRGLSSPVCRVSGKGDTGCDEKKTKARMIKWKLIKHKTFLQLKTNKQNVDKTKTAC